MARRRKIATAFTGEAPEQERETPETGHNAGIAAAHLKSFVDRIERLEEEKKAIADDIKDVFAEAKANGFDTKALRAILKMRREDDDARRELQAIVDLYMEVLGMVPFDQTPLGAGLAGGAQ